MATAATPGHPDTVWCDKSAEVRRLRTRPLLTPTAEPPGHEAHERQTGGRSDLDPFQRIQVRHEPFVRVSEGVWNSAMARLSASVISLYTNFSIWVQQT